MSLQSSLALLAATLVAAPLAAADTLDRELVRAAPTLIKHCKDAGCTNVGVLKFLVTRDGKKLSDNVGTLNLLLARRLEVALVLRNDPKQPVGIIDNASAVAHRIKGANHLQKDARLKLFNALYPLAWGAKEVTPDAFFTGLASIGPDLKTLTIDLLFFDKKTNKLTAVAELTAVNQPEYLVEMGESFNTRGLFDPDEAEKISLPKKQELVAKKAREVHNGTAKHPSVDPQAPVVLEIYYDGQKIDYEVRGGKAFIPEPREGQQVKMVLKRDNVAERYGVVLKVNGESTIFKQTLPDPQCLRWILEPGNEREVLGYQKDDETIERFRVLSVEESKAREVNYGKDVGTITVSVFRERKGKAPAPAPTDDDAEEAPAVAKATLEVRNEKGELEKPANIGALKASLLEEANRGLVAEGQVEPGKINRVKFQPDPTPIMSFTVVYVHPKDLPPK